MFVHICISVYLIYTFCGLFHTVCLPAEWCECIPPPPEGWFFFFFVEGEKVDWLFSTQDVNAARKQHETEREREREREATVQMSPNEQQPGPLSKTHTHTHWHTPRCTSHTHSHTNAWTLIHMPSNNESTISSSCLPPPVAALTASPRHKAGSPLGEELLVPV